MITVNGLAKSFNGRAIFAGVACQVKKGEILVLVGSSGVGKTTLLRIIAGLQPFDGQVVVNGQSLDPSNPTPTPSTAFVSQTPSLWQHLTVLQNVSLVRGLLLGEDRPRSDERAMQLLNTLDVLHVAKQYPATLSGGEQQRVAFARGLATERPILLLDEITANIDSARKHTVLGVIREQLGRGTTIVLATHDVEIASALSPTPFKLVEHGLLPLKPAE